MHQSDQDIASQQGLIKLLKSAIYYYQQGNLPQTELLCRHIQYLYGDHPDVNNLLGMIALAIGLPEFAVSYLKRAHDTDPANTAVCENLKFAESRQKEYQNKALETETLVPATTGGGNKRFLLIKAWGCGFWADVDNVLGQLLLAEITDRIPVVHWGENSLFREPDCNNAWNLYFEPVSPYSIDDLSDKITSLYPPKWSKNNLHHNDINKWSGQYSRVAGIYLLNRDEDLVVHDFHTYVKDLVPWINEKHPLYGITPQEIYRFLFKKYIHLKPDIEEKINLFRRDHIEGHSTLAVHVRGSDKLVESKELWEINSTYHEKIAEYLEACPGGRIFLLTDSQKILDEYRGMYKESLIYTNCQRTSSNKGVHEQEHNSMKKIGVDVIKDVYIAAGCDQFLGLGHSNVSTAILHVKNWSEENYTLLGENRLYAPNFFLYRR